MRVSPGQRIIGDVGTFAAAGEIGEFVTATLNQAGAIALTTNVAATITSILLTAGEWDINGVGDWLFAGTTSFTALQLAISLQGAVVPSQAGQTVNGVTLGTDPLEGFITPAEVPGAGVYATGVGPVRVVVPSGASPAPVFLTTLATFTVAGLSAFGTIRARRVQ